MSQGPKLLILALRGDCEISPKQLTSRVSLLRGISPTVIVVFLGNTFCIQACGAGISGTGTGGARMGVRYCWGV